MQLSPFITIGAAPRVLACRPQRLVRCAAGAPEKGNGDQASNSAPYADTPASSTALPDDTAASTSASTSAPANAELSSLEASFQRRPEDALEASFRKPDAAGAAAARMWGWLPSRELLARDPTAWIGSPAVLATALAGFSLITADLFLPGSRHLFADVDLANHAYVAEHFELGWRRDVGERMISEIPILAGLGLGALCALVLAARRPAQAAKVLGPTSLIYVFGGGFIPHQDALFVYNLKEFFHRVRPSNDLHHSFSYPSGHTTSSAIIAGTLLFILLPAAISAVAPPAPSETDVESDMEQSDMETDMEPSSGAGPSGRAVAASEVLLETEARSDSSASTSSSDAVMPPSPMLVTLAPWLLPAWAGATGMTAVGRVLSDAHWTTDTLAAYFCGLGLVSVNAMAVRALTGSTEQPRE